MLQSDFNRLRIAGDHGVAVVTIDNPPVNLLDAAVMGEIRRFLVAARADDDLRVIVFDSADPEFFLAHVDMMMGEQPESVAELSRNVPDGLNPFQALTELLRSQPQVTIVKLAGIARGGGAEFVAAADMAFAAEETAGLAQCEALMGITPGGGATQYLGARMPRSRALEIILGSDLFDARTAERYGWINRTIPAAEIDGFVATLARNIAALPDGVIAAAKAAIGQPDHGDGFVRETQSWASLVFRPETGALMMAQLQAGAQTREGERELEAVLRGATPIPSR